MSVRSSARRLRRLLLTVLSVAALVSVAVALPAFAHDTNSGTKGSKCQEMEGMDMCGNGVYRGKTKGKAKLAVGTMHTIDGALTGDSPCEKSGPPGVGRPGRQGLRGPRSSRPPVPVPRDPGRA